MPFVKLDCGILDSSLWTVEDAETRIVFITMLAMSDAEGLCRATAPGIAARARIDLAAARKALKRLEAPDPDDRSGVEEGRRVVRGAGGYQITNYLTYRDRDYTSGARAKRYRDRKRVTRDDRDDTRNVTQAEAYLPSAPRSVPPLGTPPPLRATTDNGAETEAAAAASENRAATETDVNFETFWATYPKKTAKHAALAAWKRLNPSGTQTSAIFERVMQMRGLPDAQREGGRYLPNAANWLERREWEDAPAIVPHQRPNVSAKELADRSRKAIDDFLKRKRFMAKKGGAA